MQTWRRKHVSKMRKNTPKFGVQCIHIKRERELLWMGFFFIIVVCKWMGGWNGKDYFIIYIYKYYKWASNQIKWGYTTNTGNTNVTKNTKGWLRISFGSFTTRWTWVICMGKKERNVFSTTLRWWVYFWLVSNWIFR